MLLNFAHFYLSLNGIMPYVCSDFFPLLVLETYVGGVHSFHSVILLLTDILILCSFLILCTELL